MILTDREFDSGEELDLDLHEFMMRWHEIESRCTGLVPRLPGVFLKQEPATTHSERSVEGGHPVYHTVGETFSR